MPAIPCRWLSRLLLSILILALLAGCAGLPAGAAAEPVTLRFAYVDQAADYQTLAKDFHSKYPNITIELRPAKTNYGDLMKNLAELAGDSDAVRLPVLSLPSGMETQFLALDGFLSTNQTFPKADLISGSLEALRVDGKQMGLPAGLNPFVMYYNTRKFKANGYAVPSAEWTLQDFVQTAQRVNQTDAALVNTDQFLYGFCSYPASTDGIIFSYLFGGGIFDSLVQISKPTLNQQANVDALAWYASLWTEKQLMPESPLDNARAVGSQVYRGNCAFWIDWLNRSSWGNYDATDVAPLPLPSHLAQFNIASQDAYFVLAKSEHPEEAWQWISYLMQQESAAGSLIPPLHSEIDSTAFANRASKEVVDVARALPNTTVMISLDMMRSERFGKVLEVYGQAALKVFRGAKTPEAALNEAQQQAEAAFK